MLWASFNVMIGPALSLKLWVPGLTWRQFLGVVGATFGALLIMVTMQTTLQTLFFPGAEPGLQNTSENILGHWPDRAADLAVDRVRARLLLGSGAARVVS